MSDVLNPNGWGLIGFAVFWGVLAFAGNKIPVIRGAFGGRWNVGNWVENFCLACLVACLAGTPVMRFLSAASRAVPGVIYQVTSSFVNAILTAVS